MEIREISNPEVIRYYRINGLPYVLACDNNSKTVFFLPDKKLIEGTNENVRNRLSINIGGELPNPFPHQFVELSFLLPPNTLNTQPFEYTVVILAKDYEELQLAYNKELAKYVAKDPFRFDGFVARLPELLRTSRGEFPLISVYAGEKGGNNIAKIKIPVPVERNTLQKAILFLHISGIILTTMMIGLFSTPELQQALSQTHEQRLKSTLFLAAAFLIVTKLLLEIPSAVDVLEKYNAGRLSTNRFSLHRRMVSESPGGIYMRVLDEDEAAGVTSKQIILSYKIDDGGLTLFSNNMDPISSYVELVRTVR